MATSSNVRRHGQSARQAGREAGRQAEKGGRKGLTMLARAGYAARGIVYIVVGVLAVLAAIQGLGVSTGGAEGSTTGTKGAIQAILDLPAGTWLVAAIAVGLLGFTLWRLVQGFGDADSHGSDAKGWAIRLGMVFSGIIHLGLALYAASLIWTGLAMAGGGSGGGGGGGGSAGVTAWIMQQPWGYWVIAAFGVIAIGVAGSQVVKAVKKKYKDKLDPRAANSGWIDKVARFGLGAKALVLAMVGVFLISAAFGSGSAQSAGLPQVLATLQAQPYGAWLLGITAAGLVAFGVFGLVQAKYRIIPQP
ncbi:hypothetical protein C882_2734 [Caenispirillum salinarum AK4]|uniref:DUF1206 domain-containing protein n=1 Tax=Caenispirillum salinarum AK4 TaxID=1238182 RepID=K9H366_9PROT|nr:DUF1206 domain-containing protein [Caenispirillum salinarum]EKV32655.1 hypothetical protein C882_2734 [Caenispirillum salinarum AK4]